MKITWDASQGADTYNLYLATASGITKESYSSLPNGDVRRGIISPFTITNLIAYERYSLVVTAVASEKESSESEEISAKVFGTFDSPSGHSCVSLESGKVKCWGANLFGELGKATSPFYSAIPILLGGVSNAVAVAVGEAHSCAVLLSGIIQCWGANGYGQLGDGSLIDSSDPIMVNGITNAVAVAAYGARTCAVLKDNTIRCWGIWTDSSHFDSDGNPLNSSIPLPVEGITTAVSVAVGRHHLCALLMDGSVECWGGNTAGQLGNDTMPTSSFTPVKVTGISTATAIVAASDHTCALLSGGAIQCWGSNNHGELGNGTINDVTPAAHPVNVIGIGTAISIAARADADCALMTSGAVWCWGAGPLGDGTAADASSPVQVAGITTAVTLVPGGTHTCARLANGGIQCWGFNESGQLGNGTTDSSPPVFVNGIDQATSLSSGPNYNCSVDRIGGAWCWGINDVGQLGNGTTIDSSVPVRVQGITNAVAVSVGSYLGNPLDSTCAVLNSGEVKCWGRNEFGKLGDGGDTDSSVPVTVIGVSTAVAVAVGGQHACALLSDGTVKCWGSSTQLGNGSSNLSANSTSVEVGGLSNVTSIAAGHSDTCVLLSDGRVKCWGLDSPTPVSVAGISNAIAISSWGFRNCAVLSDQTLRCWGGDDIFSPDPPGLSNIAAIGSTGWHSCAALLNGTIECWGLNWSGSIGVPADSFGALELREPHVVTGIFDAIGVGAGANHSCALLSSGKVKCWGSNFSGQLGDGNGASYLPVEVVGF